MATSPARRRLTPAFVVLQFAVGGLFLFAGGSKLLGAAEMVDFFDRLGWGQWLRYAFGALEACASVALLIPRYVLPGALALSISLLGHILVHALVLHRSPGFLVALLVVTSLIAAFRWPTTTAPPTGT
jgi:putative oxidoreductase